VVVGKVPQAEGTVFPASVHRFRLLESVHTVKAGNTEEDDGFGKIPDSWLLARVSMYSCVKLPMLDGIVPLNWLLPKSSFVSFVRLPILEGIEPFS